MSDSDKPLSMDDEAVEKGGRGKRKIYPVKQFDETDDENKEENSQSLLENLPKFPFTKQAGLQNKKAHTGNSEQTSDSLFASGYELNEIPNTVYPITNSLTFTSEVLENPETSSPQNNTQTNSYTVELADTQQFTSIRPHIMQLTASKSPQAIMHPHTSFTTHQLQSSIQTSPKQIHTSSSQNTQHISTHQSPLSIYPDDKSNLLGKIFKELFYIKKEQERQGAVIDKILKKMYSDTVPPESEVLFKPGMLPFNSITDIKEFDLKLTGIAVQNQLVMKLRRFGGHMYQDHTRRIMKYLFTDSVAENYSWLGNKEKQCFSSLNIANLIIDAVQQENEPVTRAQIEDVLKTWLRHAKERRCYVKKCMNKKNVE